MANVFFSGVDTAGGRGRDYAQRGTRAVPEAAAATFMAATSSLVAKRPLILGRTSA